MNAKNLTIGGAFTAVVAGIIYKYGELITDGFLLLTALVLFFVVLSYLISWGVTQAFKRLYLTPKQVRSEPGKRNLYRCALYSGSGCMLLCGSLFLLADLTTNEKIVVGVFWLLACAFVGFSSPLVWRWTFDKLLPRFNRFVVGKKDDEHGHEALDRPPEPK